MSCLVAYLADPEVANRTLLSVIGRVTLLTAVAVGLVNARQGAWTAVTALSVLAVVSALTIWVSRTHYRLASSVLVLSILMVANVTLADGRGLRDPGVLAYALAICLGMLLVGRRTVPLWFIAGSVSMAMIGHRDARAGSYGPESFYDIVVAIILLAACTVVVWIMIERSDGYVRRIRQSEAELREAYDVTLEAWGTFLEYRDKDTEGHCRRVMDLSVRLARALDCSEDQIVHIRRGALLHDIGKLAIPDHILLKTSSLDDEERKIMQRHPVLARDMLSGIPFLKPAIDIPYCHHERWDGLGYPRGLRGLEIPLSARLFAVVDQWEALSSDRPYRAAWPIQRIVHHMMANAGKMFDPDIVKTFFTVVPGLNQVVKQDPPNGLSRGSWLSKRGSISEA